jgi:solute carrier family 13 (sodium-dependent dicarboxylate transporter), member 2/3/5
MTYGLRQRLGAALGPVCLLVTLFVPAPAGLSPAGWHTAGVALLMAIWWISESVPIPVTALLPLVLFPALHLADIKEAAAPYANPLIFLFFGGFIIALAMQKTNLHRRVAINLIALMGTQPSRIIAGFLLASALVSMWVSNTATALMMLPIAVSVVLLIPEGSKSEAGTKDFGPALLLAVAYGATTGGMSTLIGTPPNALLAGYLNSVYHINIGFGQWMLLGVPVTLVTLPAVYWVLTRVSFRLPRGKLRGMEEMIHAERLNLGRFSRGEIIVTTVFGLTALGWMTQPLLSKALPMLSDTTIAMAGAILLFLIPLNLKRGEFVMDWAATKGLPWDVLLLFGGGLSLAGNIQTHGLAHYLGTLSQGLHGLPILLTVTIICFGILMLTELTSNTATAATFLPIVGAIALSLGQNPLLCLIPTALAANCSYMMPVGTPPNAIVFGSGMITLPQMAKAGFLLNLLLVPIIVGIVWLLGPLVFGIEFDLLPAWVTGLK